MIKYSIVTINFKTAPQVQDLWNSLEQHLPAESFEFILLDNNSGEAETELLNKFFDQKKQAHFMALQQNLGFGGGYAEAIRFAQGEFLVLINPDVQITAGCLERLEQCLEAQAQVGIAAPQLINPDGSLQANARQWPTLWNLCSKRFGGQTKILPPGPVPWVQGSFIFMRRRFFSDVLQGFDPRFFLFFEDTDLCRRTWLAGFKVWLCDEVQAIHSPDRLSGNDIFRAMRRKTFWIHVHSALKYFWKYKGDKSPLST